MDLSLWHVEMRNNFQCQIRCPSIWQMECHNRGHDRISDKMSDSMSMSVGGVEGSNSILGIKQLYCLPGELDNLSASWCIVDLRHRQQRSTQAAKAAAVPSVAKVLGGRISRTSHGAQKSAGVVHMKWHTCLLCIYIYIHIIYTYMDIYTCCPSVCFLKYL